MMKIKLSILLLFFSLKLCAQSPWYDSTRTLQTVDTYGNNNKNGRFRGSLNIPMDTIKMARKDSGAIVFKSSNIYLWDGYKWVKGGINVLPYSLTKNAAGDSIILSDGVNTYKVKDSIGAGGGGSTYTLSKNATRDSTILTDALGNRSAAKDSVGITDTIALRNDLNIAIAQGVANAAAIQQRPTFTNLRDSLDIIRSKHLADSSAQAGLINAKQNLVTLTTTGSSGAATFNQGTGALNIPNYAGTVSSFSSADLSTLFTTSVATSTTTPALSFAQSNINQFQILGRKASGTGAYSFLTSDSSLIPDLHSESYYNTKYAAFGGGGSGWGLTGTNVVDGNVFGSSNNRSVRYITNNIERLVIDSLGKVFIGGPAFQDYKLTVTGKIAADRILASDTLFASQISGINNTDIKFNGNVVNTASGKLGVGILVPLNRLHVFSASTADGITIDGSSFPAMIMRQSGVIKAYAPFLATSGGGFMNNTNEGDIGFRSEANDVLIGRSTGGPAIFMAGINVRVNTGSNAATASASFEVGGTDKGALLPRMTTTQMNAIASPAIGLMIYNTTDNVLAVYNGTWQKVTTTSF